MPETQVSPNANYAARPTLRVDGVDDDRVRELLVGMEMHEREGGLSSLELRFGNVASDDQGGADAAFEDDSVLRLGAEITVHAGDEDAPLEIFRGKVTALEAEFDRDRPPELTVLAEDALQTARMERRTRLWEDVSVADLVEEVARDAGLAPVVDISTETMPLVVQWNETTLALLRRLLARVDADVQVVGNELHAAARSGVRRGEVEVLLSGQIRSMRIAADLAHQVDELTVAGWDATRAQRVVATASGSHLEPGRGRSGADWIRQEFGGRSEHLGHLPITTDGEATAFADAAFDRRARGFVTARGIVDGNPAIRVGTHLHLSDVGPRFANVYYVTECRHRFDLRSGYLTELRAECAYFGEGGS